MPMPLSVVLLTLLLWLTLPTVLLAVAHIALDSHVPLFLRIQLISTCFLVTWIIFEWLLNLTPPAIDRVFG